VTNAKELLEKLTAAGVEITITSEKKLKVSAPSNILSGEQREQLRVCKADLLTLLTQKSHNQEVPDVCPICGATLKADKTPAILVRFCPFGCPSLYCAFNDWMAARALAGEMLDAASFDECETMANALDERTAILMIECGFDYETAMRRAEADLIPIWLNEYQLTRKFK